VGWADGRTLGTLGLAAVSGALFVQRCRTARAPLLRLEIFRERRFLTATVSQLGSQLSIFACVRSPLPVSDLSGSAGQEFLGEGFPEL
jgi:hypothetical protein